MNNIIDFSALDPTTICIGSHPGIIQSMLDYSYCIGNTSPNILCIVASGHKQERYFWGEHEISISVYPDLSSVPDDIKKRVSCLFNAQSARRVLTSMTEALETLPNLKLVNIFAEQVPEAHAIEISEQARDKGLLIAGPSSVGLLVPGILKLGAIGGTQYAQLAKAGIFVAGDTAVVSTSGGMVNELIHTITGTGLRVSFALALGGDRYPITTPADAFLYAQNDPKTKRIVYFGELGGEDEYVIADLIREHRVTKPIIAYIAGTVAELFTEPPQFGHAKAMASKDKETAKAKKTILREVGVNVIDVFADLPDKLQSAHTDKFGDTATSPPHANTPDPHQVITERHKRLIASHISGEVDGDVQLLGKDLLATIENHSLAGLTISLLLGENIESEKLISFTNYVLRLLADHGPYVSGAVNTIVAARAGKDLAASLATGLLTIGPRFGGAVNGAAQCWLQGALSQITPKSFVTNFKTNGGIIPGIGHKKYRIDVPDPRIDSLTKQFANNSNGDRYLVFARSVEAITTSKKGNLILNVDGCIAAIMLDILESELNYSPQQLQELIDIEFFNAIFILSRSVGFAAHYLDQRRNDEGLLRLSDNEIAYLP